MAEWIDVNERLPNKSRLVLCYLKENSFGDNLRLRLAYFNRKEERFYEATRYADDNWCSNLYPIYWMPLPEPPRTQKERGADKPKVTCLNCKHLEITLPYGECSRQLRIVKPDDTCKYAEPKERGREK